MRRVVVIGYGIVSPLGLSAPETWNALLEGRTGVGPITLFDTDGFDIKIAAEVKGFDPAALLDSRAARRQDRCELLANVAAQEAIQHSGLEITEADGDRIGLSISCAFGGMNSMVEEITAFNAYGPKRVNPLGLLKFMTTSPTISIAHGLRGPSFSAASACASGADGIGLALHLIRAGAADAMLAGGTDAAIIPISITLLDRMRVYSRRADHTPSPFSAERDGLVAGEGACVLVLASLEFAKQHGAPILAELAGYGATTDAYHITAPLEDGGENARAIRLALEDARLTPGDVDYVNAHGTGTQLNDGTETRAIKKALGRRAYEIPVSSTKSMTGHIMAATGAMEAVFCVQAICHGVVPPTINYGTPDPDCDLDYVPNEAREHPVRVAVSNASGFGGHNAVLVFRAFDG
jgi:3-oxoacyl-[acyl-carrier-protein] synthase II